ncbi:hypothetical protein ASF53_14205 [Methylobacterium sp. Leaf123]|uniref:hypothetical protein n=1 Tax=Methylobacterium sp. Leaf123 TaxID=1736264 RepID=UPI0006F2FB40|nr:hypothetical protein [Methylobacterium sp. Leaf123]KQQ13316.1 hypothetical protein ASF53_14205 [Methylobacterium sp. Leaf123]
MVATDTSEKDFNAKVRCIAPGNALTEVPTDISKFSNDLFYALQEMASRIAGSITKGVGG